MLGPSEVVGYGSEGRGTQVPHNLVQAGNLLLQQVVLLLCDFLPILRHLQSLEELRVLNIQVLDHLVRLGVPVELRERERGFDLNQIEWFPVLAC